MFDAWMCLKRKLLLFFRGVCFLFTVFFFVGGRRRRSLTHFLFDVSCVNIAYWYKKRGVGYFRFRNSINSFGVVVTYWNPFSIRSVASLALVAVLHAYSSVLNAW